MAARARKRLGQHFLVSRHHARRIVESVPAERDDNVLEIGPGRGALSVFLLERFPRFHCVEKDTAQLPQLREKLGPGAYTVHAEDVLTFDFARVGFPLHVVGNLPYSVAAPILHKTLRHGTRIASCTFMVQREVAERIVARPHTKRNGYLTVFCRFFGRPRVLFHLAPGAFQPRPRVQSSVFQMRIDTDLEEKLPPDRRGDFFAFVDRGFGQRRKKLVGVLGRAYPEVDFERCFRDAGVDPMCRAEDLGVEEWLRLFRSVRSC
jgi:16S rRNA (adenine1518-N6/adenine1519-N6)-dimethyltransferase